MCIIGGKWVKSIINIKSVRFYGMVFSAVIHISRSVCQGGYARKDLNIRTTIEGDFRESSDFNQPRKQSDLLI